MARKKKKARRKVNKKGTQTGRVSSSKPNVSNTPKTEKAERTSVEERCKSIRHILRVIGKQVAEHQEATTTSKKHEHLNAAIVGSETLWQNLRAMAREN